MKGKLLLNVAYIGL